MGKIWFSLYDFSFDYQGDESPFCQMEGYKWSREMENLYPKIKEELSAYLQKNELISYFSGSMVTKPGSWQTISLVTWGIHMYKVKKHFPVICEVLSRYPEIVSASFSMLEPNSKILPHCGDTNAIYRCHLGIDIPAGLPFCGLKVKNEDRAWENGKWFGFMDAYQHEAWNDSERSRYVFIVDVMRPEFMGKKNYVCSTVRTSLFLQRRVKDLTLRPRLAAIGGKLLRPLIQLGISLVNAFKYY